MVSSSSLYVDLDGTLIATDLLHESLLQLLRVSPLSIAVSTFLMKLRTRLVRARLMALRRSVCRIRFFADL